jgi:hypothetical protein
VTLTATPDAGHRFVAWSGACEGTTCIVTMNSAKTVTATFEPIAVDPGTSVVTVQVNGNGTVTSNPPGLQAPGTPSFAFADDTLVTLTAVPGTGATFDGWGGACADAGTNPTCEVMVTAATNVIANFTGGATLVSSTIAADTDDAEEFLAASLNNATRYQRGFTFTGSSSLELGFDPTHGPQVVGLRFTGINLPEDAQIQSAQLVFTAYGGTTGVVGTGTVNLTIRAQASATPPTFTRGTNDAAGNFDITNRTLLGTPVPWTIDQTWVAGTTYASADVSELVQDVVDLGPWGPTNAIVFVIEGEAGSTAFRRAYTRETNAARAVTLRIEYTLP